jgi:hypothetical protein
MVRNQAWDFEFVFRSSQWEPTSSALYDTDNDGTIDMIQVVAKDNKSQNILFTLTNEGWRFQKNATFDFCSEVYFRDKRLAQRFHAIKAGMARKSGASE